MTITNTSSLQSAAKEAQETAAQTRLEASQGDQQAVRKLAATQGAKSASANPGTAAPTAPAAPQKDNDVDSDRGTIDAKA